MPPGAEVSPRRAIAQEANEAFCFFLFIYFLASSFPPSPLISANFSSECDDKAGFSSFLALGVGGSNASNGALVSFPS